MKPIPFQKENQLSAFLKSRGCNREQLSLQFCLRMMSQIDLLRSSIGENYQRYFVAMIEQKFSSCSHGFCIITSSVSICCLKYKSLANASAFLFQTTFLHLGSYSAANTFQTTFLHLGSYSAANTIMLELFFKYMYVNNCILGQLRVMFCPRIVV